MDIQRCPNGHFYDASQNASCPTCSRSGGNTGFGDFGGGSSYGATEPVGATLPADGGVGATMPIGAPDNFGFDNSASSIPACNYGVTEAIVASPAAQSGYGTTVPIGPSYGDVKSARPVVGWLVCTNGPSKGSDFRIFPENNTIGRAASNDVVIPDDPHITGDRAATITYDSRSKAFYFANGNSKNIIRLNDIPVLQTVMLNAYDKVEIGETTLLFVPFCGERFDWNA